MAQKELDPLGNEIEAPGELQTNRPFYKRKTFWIPLILLIGIGVAGWYWYKSNAGFVSSDDAFIDADRLSVSSKILGRITNLYVTDGDTVQAGQVLARLDSTDLIAQKNQAIASLNLANETIPLSKVNIAKATEDYERAKLQLQKNIITKEQYDHAQKALEAANAELNINKSKIESAKAQLDVITTQLKNTTIYSPMEGVVAKKWVLEGNVVQPGEPIFSVYNMKEIWVTANLEETDIRHLVVGNPVSISVDSYPNLSYSGEILKIGTNTASQFSLIPPNNASGNFTKVTQRIPVKISIKQTGGSTHPALLPGMSTEIKIKIQD
jgi:membrane fusion protein (multidrug efflux system)